MLFQHRHLLPLLLCAGSLACQRLTVGAPATGDSGPTSGDSEDSEPGGDDPDDSDPIDPGDSCQPQADIADPFYLEGDRVSFSMSCGSGAERQDYSLSITGLPSGASFDEQTWEVDWQTGYADGARYDLLLAARPADEQGGFPESAVASFWVADAVGNPENEPVVAAEYTEEWGLPVFHFEPSGSLTSTHIPADLTVMGHLYHVEMKVRGAYSSGFPKQSYTVRFSDEDLDASHWDMGNKDHLYVITPFDDNSYVRQKLAYDMWQAIADHWKRDRLAPRTFFGVAYMNGAYHGLYLFSDRPDDHFAQEMGLSSEGNLYKAVNHDANFFRTGSGGGLKGTLHDGYEKKEGPPEDWSDIDALVAFCADSSDDEFYAQADEWMRSDEFMDWFIFVHHTSSDDSAGKNSYLYNDPEAFEFRYCPWDFNHSFGQGWYTYRVPSNSYNDFKSYNAIFAHFQNGEEASEELWGRFWELMNEGPLRLEWLHEKLDSYYEQMERNAERDWEVWGSTFHSSWSSYNPNDYLQEREYLYQWLEERDEWMHYYHGDQK